jgi:hypothetical protein
MNKKDKLNKFWNKVITSDILPIAWGTSVIFIITTVLLTLSVLAFGWLLKSLGVM